MSFIDQHSVEVAEPLIRLVTQTLICSEDEVSIFKRQFLRLVEFASQDSSTPVLLMREQEVLILLELVDTLSRQVNAWNNVEDFLH